MNGSHSGNFAVADWIWRPAPGLPDFGRRCYPAVANTMKNLLSQSGRSLGDEEILEILHALNGAGMDGTPLSLGIADTADKDTEDAACRLVSLALRIRPEEIVGNGEYPPAPGGRDRNRFPLCIAAEKGLSTLVATLLQNGFCPGVMDGRRMTPLACAARNGDARMAKLLLDAGADPFLGSLRMRTVPLCAAAEAPSNKDVRDVLNVILDADWTRDEKWKSVLEEHLTYALSVVISTRRYDVAYLFLDAGANPVIPVPQREKGPHDELMAGIRRRCGAEEKTPSAHTLLLRVALSSMAELEVEDLFNRMMSVLPSFVLRDRFVPVKGEFRAAMRAAFDETWDTKRNNPDLDFFPYSGISRIIKDKTKALGNGETLDLAATAKSLRMSNVPELRTAARLLELPDPMEEGIPKEERLCRTVAVLEEGWMAPGRERSSGRTAFDFSNGTPDNKVGFCDTEGDRTI